MRLALRIAVCTWGILLMVMAMVMLDERQAQAPAAKRPPQTLELHHAATHSKAIASLCSHIDSLDANDRFDAYQTLQLYRDAAVLYAGNRLDKQALAGLLNRYDPSNDQVHYVCDAAGAAVFAVRRSGSALNMRQVQRALFEADQETWVKRAKREPPKIRRRDGEQLRQKINELIGVMFAPCA